MTEVQQTAEIMESDVELAGDTSALEKEADLLEHKVQELQRDIQSRRDDLEKNLRALTDSSGRDELRRRYDVAIDGGDKKTSEEILGRLAAERKSLIALCKTSKSEPEEFAGFDERKKELHGGVGVLFGLSKGNFLRAEKVNISISRSGATLSQWVSMGLREIRELSRKVDRACNEILGDK